MKDNDFNQMNLFNFNKEYKRIRKPVRLIEFFAGIGSQAKDVFDPNGISPTTGTEFPNNCTFCCSSLFDDCIKRRFANEYVKVYALIVKNRKTRKIIYQGNDYNEFRKEAEKYE